STSTWPSGSLQHHPHRPQKDLDIQPDRLLLDVLHVVVNPFLKIRFHLTLARDLPQSGDSGADAQPRLAPRRAHLVFTIGAWPRADDAHVADQHVIKLRPLVHVEPPQPRADRENPRITLNFELRHIHFA